MPAPTRNFAAASAATTRGRARRFTDRKKAAAKKAARGRVRIR
jgi:hypothetical protein